MLQVKHHKAVMHNMKSGCMLMSTFKLLLVFLVSIR